jgi:hypothetical protein
MSLEGHLIELQRRHEALKKEIEQERRYPRIDESKLLELKRKKLQVKDAIAKLCQGATAH